MAVQGFDPVMVQSVELAWDLSVEQIAEVVAGLLVDFGDRSVDKLGEVHWNPPLLD